MSNKNLSEVEQILKRLRNEVHPDFNLVNAHEVSKDLQRLVDERDKARELCRWAFYRLFSMAYDGPTFAKLVKKMQETPEIFNLD